MGRTTSDGCRSFDASSMADQPPLMSDGFPPKVPRRGECGTARGGLRVRAERAGAFGYCDSSLRGTSMQVARRATECEGLAGTVIALQRCPHSGYVAHYTFLSHIYPSRAM